MGAGVFRLRELEIALWVKEVSQMGELLLPSTFSWSLEEERDEGQSYTL